MKALQKLRARLLEAGHPVPKSVSSVEARVLKFDTPVGVRQLFAGAHQNQQANVRAVPLWRTAALVCAHLLEGKEEKEAMKLAIAKTGRPRPATVEELRKKWGPFLATVQALGDQASAAIKGLEERQPIQPGTFVPLRPLQTPQHREMAARHLLEKGATIASWRTHCSRVVKTQWVDFSWRAGNPHVEEDKRMLLST